MAIEDAAVLARLLSEHRRIDNALDEYVKRRLRRVTLIQNRSRSFGWLGHFRSGMACAVRDFMLRRVANGYLQRMVLARASG